MKKVTRYVTLTITVEEADGQYAAHCIELITASCGDTIDEAFKNIKEAITVDLNALEETGEREQFFNEHGIEIKQRIEEDIPLVKPICREAWTRAYDAKVLVPA